MKQFKPTYLYIKQHTVSGKLYFGKTVKSDIHSYLGSGVAWKSHINKHGKEHVITLWFQLYDNPFDLVADAISMSRSLDIVNSKSWLNLTEENGINTGSGYRHSSTSILQMSIGKLGNANPFYGKSHSEETKTKMSKAQLGNKKFLGKTHSAETRLKISAANKGRINSKESRLKISAAQKALSEIQCPHCGILSKSRGNMKRWHFDNCKQI